MLLSSLQPPLLKHSLQLSKFHCHKDYDHPASCNWLHRGYQECGCPSLSNQFFIMRIDYGITLLILGLYLVACCMEYFAALVSVIKEL